MRTHPILVRPELVEGLHFFREEGQPFDRLRANGRSAPYSTSPALPIERSIIPVRLIHQNKSTPGSAITVVNR